jgi:adenine deaminase
LSRRYQYPKAAYTTVKVKDGLKLIPEMPKERGVIHAIRTALPGIVLFHDRVEVTPEKDWATLFKKHDLCFVTVVERHGKTAGNVAYGFLKDFGLKRGAVGSSVGHDSHNIILAGTNEVDMRVALDAIRAAQGGACVVADGKVLAMLPLPIAGLLSDKRVGDVAEQVKTLKVEWEKAGCTIPYMGFNLIPLSVIPELRITDKGLVLVPETVLLPTFEPLTNA